MAHNGELANGQEVGGSRGGGVTQDTVVEKGCAKPKGKRPAAACCCEACDCSRLLLGCTWE